MAERGNAAAQSNLGILYRDGRGVRQNYAESAKWFRKSAEQGFAPAQLDLGVAYERGLGVKRNDVEAGKWYRKAAKQGNRRAQFNIGIMYRAGRGVKRDYAQSVAWFRKSAEQGFARAQNALGWAYQNGFGVKRNYAHALEWYRKSAARGLAVAQSSVGYMYSQGFGVQRNYAEAARWFRKSAEQGNASGQVQLGWTYEFGRGVKQSYIDAIKWYRRADQQGEKQAKDGLKRIGDNKIAQAILHVIGFYDGAIDGKLGGNTVAAIKRYQKVTEIPPSGKVDSKLVKALFESLDTKLDVAKTKSIVDEGMKLLRAGFYKAAEKKFETAIDQGYRYTLGMKIYPHSKKHLSCLGYVSLYQWNRALKQKPTSRLGILTKTKAAQGDQIRVRVTSVFPNGPSDVAGVKTGDVIIAVDGQSFPAEKQFDKYIRTIPVGQSARLTILRKQERIDIRLTTGPGFAGLGMAIFALYEYGFFATQAGHPGITLQAAAALRKAAGKYPAAMNANVVQPFIISLEALAWAAQGQYDKAYRHIVENGGLFKGNLILPAVYIKMYPNVWKPLYVDRKKLAYILKTDEHSLPMPSAASQAPQPYPAIDGKLITPTTAPLPQLPSQKSGPSVGAPQTSKPAPKAGASDVMTLE